MIGWVPVYGCVSGGTSTGYYNCPPQTCVSTCPNGSTPGGSCGTCGTVQADCSCSDPPPPSCACGSATCQNGSWSACPQQTSNYQLGCDGTGNSASGSAGNWTTPACVTDTQCVSANGAGYFCAYIATCKAQCAPDDGGGDDGGCDPDTDQCGCCDEGYDCELKGDYYACVYEEDPVAIDLTGDGFVLTSVQGGVMFDFFGTHEPRQTSWTAAGSDVAWLVLDLNGNGVIDSGLEMFGNVTPQPGKAASHLGFKALAVYDLPANGGNGDGVIDAQDRIFSRLRLWVDKNHNGISEPGELLTLQQAGIQSISLNYQTQKWTDAYGNKFQNRAKIVFAGHGQGGDHWAYDVVLVTAK